MQKVKYICIMIILLLFIFLNSVTASEPEIKAKAAVLMDVKTGQVLYNKHMHVKLPPASLTKILTAITAIEEGNLQDTVVVSRKAAYQEGSSIWLQEGEKLTLVELIYAVMLASANDAAVAVAEHISGSVEEFSVLMNKKAEEIGALNSNFLNPSGLPCSGHYSTAYDLAKIMCYSLKNKQFAEITSTKYKTISWADHPWDRGLRNHNKLLWSYEGITGGKTGYTKAAGRCLLTSASREGREVVAVVLNCSDDWFASKKLMDYGLKNFRYKKLFVEGEKICKITVENSAEKYCHLLAGKSVSITVPEGGSITIKKEINLLPSVDLPVKKGEKMGDISVYEENNLIAKVELLAEKDLNYNSFYKRLWSNLITVLRNNFNRGFT